MYAQIHGHICKYTYKHRISDMKLAIIAICLALIDNVSAAEDCNPERQFTCADGSCVALNDVCDGIQQCPDAFDEQDCEFRERDANYEGLPRQENMPLSEWESEVRNKNQKAQLPLKENLIYRSYNWATVIIIAFIILCAFVAWIGIQRKRKRKSRNLRGGDVINEDEDDLLISSMYAT